MIEGPSFEHRLPAIMGGITIISKVRDEGTDITREGWFPTCISDAGHTTFVLCTSVRSGAGIVPAVDGRRSSNSLCGHGPCHLISDSLMPTWLTKRIQVKVEVRRRKPLFRVAAAPQRIVNFDSTSRIKGYASNFVPSYVVDSCTGCHCIPADARR